MTTFIVRRLILSLVVLIIVSLLVFLMMRLLPGDPIYMLMTSDQLQNSTAEDIQAVRHEYGLDRSLIIQYTDWLFSALHGDLGKSIVTGQPVIAEVAKRVPVTINLSLLAFIISIIIGIPAGVICAVRRATWIDSIVTVLANIGITVPTFWLGIMLVYLFSLNLHWLPVQGYTSPFTDLSQNIRQIILPVFCLSVFPLAAIARQTRSSMLEVMRQDYIRTAWSKGLRERFIIARHALKNGIIPVITLLGVQLGSIIGGSVFIEIVFNIPGMGRGTVNAIFSHDFPVVQGLIVIVGITILLVNLIVDISYGWLDPRIRYD
jgi:peptide/nickel transport system permease protein